METLLICWSTS